MQENDEATSLSYKQITFSVICFFCLRFTVTCRAETGWYRQYRPLARAQNATEELEDTPFFVVVVVV